MSKSIIENIDSVSFGNLKITTTLNGGYDSDTPDHLKREITLHFVGFDNASDDIQESLLEELAAKLRIKVNQAPPSGELKGRASVKDAQSYAEMLDENDCEFTFDVGELYAPSSRSLSEEEKSIRSIRAMERDGKLSSENADEMIAIIQASMDAAQ